MIANEEYNLGKVIKILLIIILIILVFYGITILVTKYQKEDEEETTEENIQYEEILIGSIYSQSEDEYYVLVELENDYSKLYSTVNTYQESDELKLYTASLDDSLNKKYYSDESNFEEKFPIFKESTLIRIKDGSIVEHYEGVDSILEVLGS